MRFLLIAWLACGAAAAGEFPACYPAAGKEAPRSLDELLGCQEKARRAYRAGYVKKRGAEPPEAALDRLDSWQRAEARRFEAERQRAEAGSGKGASGGGKPQASAVKRDRLRAGPAEAAALDELAGVQKGQAGDGSKGVTPDMARAIAQHLLDAQGGMSADMAALLEAVQRDGGKLTDGTMEQLGRAARQAKSEGLDLGVPPDVERSLLEFERPGQPAGAD